MSSIEVLDTFAGSPSWRHQLFRLLSEVKDGGGDFFEILSAARAIQQEDYEDWYASWRALAERSEGRAHEATQSGHYATARKLYLKACNYYRMANFLLSPDDPRELATYEKIPECFLRAARFFTHGFEASAVPFEGIEMPAYFLHPVGKRQWPTVILMGGVDAVKEEYYFRGALDCVERGLACLLIDGPGQGAPLRYHRKYVRHDYEQPVAAMMDYLEQRGDVDAQRIAFVGASLGGYFALRTAAFEARIAACVAWSAIYNLVQDVYDFFPLIRRRLRIILGASTDEETRERLAVFNLEGVVRRIRCPLLLVHGEGDYIVSVRAAYKAVEEAICERELKIYRRNELGSLHVQQDHLDEAKAYIFDWVADRLRIPSSISN